jgi:hypothetical protein
LKEEFLANLLPINTLFTLSTLNLSTFGAQRIRIHFIEKLPL